MSIRSSYPSIAPSLSLDFAKSRRLDPRISFTRAQTGNIATYIGSDGLVKYAGPDEPRFDHRSTFRTNLFAYSEELNNWATDQTSTTITTNQIASPQESLTADKINEGTNFGVHNRYRNVGLLKSSPYTFSVYIKSGNRTSVAFSLGYAGVGGGGYAYFNLSTGSVISTEKSAADPPTGNIGTSISYEGNGWWRCSITLTPSRTDLVYYASILLLNENNVRSYAGSTDKYLYGWGAQLEEGSAPTDYIATGPAAVTKTSVESLGLLVEESRTNFIINSNASGWSNIRVTRTINSAISPDGTNNATLVTETTEYGLHRIASPSTSFTDTRTLSMWIKRNSGDRNLNINAGAIMNCGINYNFNTKTIGTYSGNVSVISYPNEWYKFILTGTGTGVSNSVYIQFTRDGNEDDDYYIGSTSNSFCVWGIQLEAGAFPTSYIPTSGTTITRPADSGCLIPDTIFPTLYNTSKGTIAWEGFPLSREISPQTGFRVSTGANLRGFGVQFDTRESINSDSVNMSFRKDSTGITSFTIVPDDQLFSNYSNIKLSTSWNVNTTAYASLNGVDKTSTDNGTLANWPNLLGTENRLEVGRQFGVSGSNNPFNGHIKQFKLYTSDVSQNINTQLSQI